MCHKVNEMFSKACEHGIKAMIYIATQSLNGERVKMGDITENIDSPEAFTAKVLGELVKHGIVESLKGPYGGFYIQPEKMKTIKVSEIVAAIDGDAIFNGCGLGLSECSHTQPCPMHHKFVKVRDGLKQMLETTTILDLAMGLKSGQTMLVRI